MVVNTLASENPDEAGRYSMDVEYGQYSVMSLMKAPAVATGALTGSSLVLVINSD